MYACRKISSPLYDLFRLFYSPRPRARAYTHSRAPLIHFARDVERALGSGLAAGMKTLAGGRMLEELESFFISLFFDIFRRSRARAREVAKPPLDSAQHSEIALSS